MNKKIRHDGVVKSVEKGCVKVRILQASACATCQASGFCHASETKEKDVDVYVDNSADYQCGEEVVVWASSAVATRALWWAFGLPFVCMVVVLLVLLRQTSNEGLAAIGALLSLFPCYGLLFLLRNRLRRQMTFGIEKKTN